VAGTPDLEYHWAVGSLALAEELLRQRPTDLLVIDKSFGVQAIIEFLTQLRRSGAATSPVVWGNSLSEAEALRFLQSGARGIVRKTSESPTLLQCLRSVGEGISWMEDCVFRDSQRPERYSRSELTTREQQVLELVEQGLKNKEIARELGIRPGTVKIHLKHIFEKTGVRGRYGLALSGMRHRVALPESYSYPAEYAVS